MKLYRNGEAYYDPTAGEAITNVEGEYEMIFRGDIFEIIKPDGTAGTPCVIVSSNEINENSDIIMAVYLKDSVKKERNTNVTVNAKTQKIAECGKVYGLHKSKIGEYIKCCNEKEMREIDKALALALGLDGPVENAAAEPAADSETGQDGQNRTAADETKSFLFDGEKTGAELKSETQIRLETERDLYKSLYEAMLDRMM